MKAFLNLLLNDSILFLIAITIIVLIILIIFCLVLLKKKYEIIEDKYNRDLDYENNVSKLKNLVTEEIKQDNVVAKETPIETKTELETVNTKDSKIDLESMLSKMEESLNEKESAITNFEQEQEEKAIISYEELKKAVNQNNNVNVTRIESLEPKNTVISEIKDVSNEINDNRNFKNTDFISPIYGKMDDNYKYPTISHLDEETNLMEAKEDIVVSEHSKDNNELFLDSLKQFRKNLE